MQERNYCVYKHTSPSNKVYIGITCQKPERRWGADGKGYYHNQYFWRSIQKYGFDNFKHEILFENLSKEEACQKEVELISFYKSNDRKFGYNITSGGDGCNGLKHSEKSKKKMSESHKGKATWNKGLKGFYHPSDEARKKISEANKGRMFSEEWKKKLSDAKKDKCSGSSNNFYGKHHTEEVRKKLSEMHRGKHLSEETRKSISKNSATPKVAIAYKEYKANGGTLKWNEFQKTFKQVK